MAGKKKATFPPRTFQELIVERLADLAVLYDFELILVGEGYSNTPTYGFKYPKRTAFFLTVGLDFQQQNFTMHFFPGNIEPRRTLGGQGNEIKYAYMCNHEEEKIANIFRWLNDTLAAKTIK